MEPRTESAFALDARTALRALLATTAFFVVLSVALQILFFFGPKFPMRDFFAWVFNVNEEKSVPTVFNFFLHGLCAFTVLAVTLLRRRAGGSYEWRWVLLVLLFVFTAGDEILVLHERLIDPLRMKLQTTGALYFAWVIPGAGFVLLVGVLELKLVLGLPAPIRWLVIASGCIFVGGALGVESLGGAEYEAHSMSFRLQMLSAVEEGMEMSGLSLFIYAMLRYVQDHLGGLRLTLTLPPREARSV